jgi:protein-L-isoaspartate(D-aspartate) O-methyltransferase
MPDPAERRARMVETQIARRGVRDNQVLEAMREVPRELFVPPGLAEFAYEDALLPIELGLTIPPPHTIARMIEAAELRPGDRVLEIGAGSGYGAAVASRIAERIYIMERQDVLTRLASDRLKQLGYDNVEFRTGDAVYGWPEAAPFDVIAVTCCGTALSQPLLDQLTVGGRLIMRVGDTPGEQRLIKVVRRSETHFEEDDLGDLAFGPLPAEPVTRPAEPKSFSEPAWEQLVPEPIRPAAGPLPELIRSAAEPLPDLNDPAFGALFDRFAKARVVLLGEATHGTSEFYRARAAITRRLIEAHGFNIVAVEADWPDAASLDRYVRHRPAPPHAEPPFRRFPTWMWRNADVEAFVEWLRGWNLQQPQTARAGFYGLDLYNLTASIRIVIDYLERVDPQAAAVARRRYGCLTPWAKDPQAYGAMALTAGYGICEEAVVGMLKDMLNKQLQYAAEDPESFLDAAANARLVKNAEAYYRAIFYGAAESWNLRDTHMFETLGMLLDARGPGAKAVVWAHNSHIGDASKTEMGVVREELNIGQLCRERFGRDAALIGFGTHTGAVACASDWEGPMEIKRILPSRADSYEGLAHDSGVARFLLDLREGVHEPLRARLADSRLERFIGVIYRPETERWSHYSACILPQQFDAYVWFDHTTAVVALPTRMREGQDETWPFGL